MQEADIRARLAAVRAELVRVDAERGVLSSLLENYARWLRLVTSRDVPPVSDEKETLAIAVNNSSEPGIDRVRRGPSIEGARPSSSERIHPRRRFRAVASAKLAEDRAPSASVARLISGENATTMVVQTVALAQIQFARDPTGTRSDPLADDPLVASVRIHGVLEPVVVRPTGLREFELLHGQRRVLAARAAGLARIPALVRRLDDAAAAELRASSSGSMPRRHQEMVTGPEAEPKPA